MVRIHRGEQADIRVEVQDTGIGISEEYLPLMFEPYSQEESGYSRAYEGIGLGLALVKRYASLNNISIAVRSTKGEGTTIELTFPPAPFSTASTPREDAP
jgi:signal transduction histidine kinase